MQPNADQPNTLEPVRTPEPFNLFSRRVDPRGVLEALRTVAGEVQVVGPEDDWREATAICAQPDGEPPLRLRVSHDSSFYEGADWPRYVFGLCNYFGAFSPVPRHAGMLRAASEFRFVLAFPDVDLAIDGDDPRVAWVHAICRRLDGIIVSPSAFLDAQGRLLMSAGGRFDADAVLPVPTGSPVLTGDLGDPDGMDVGDAADHQSSPPTADRVARRAVVMAAVGNRGLIESEYETMEFPYLACRDTLDWLRSCNVGDEPEPSEWEVLQRPCSTLDPRRTIDATWQLEGLAVLLWALRLHELPAYDELVRPAKLFRAIRLFSPRRTSRIIRKAKLRSPEELSAYANHAAMAHWRFRNFFLHPGPVDFVAMSRECWIGSFDITRFRIQSNDVMVGDRVISEADEQQVHACRGIAQERHQAINWLLGDHFLYSKTDTST